MIRFQTLAFSGVVAVTLVGCELATDVELIEFSGLGQVSGVVYRDQNGSGVFDEGDVPLDSVAVAVAPPGSNEFAGSTVTDSTGTFTLDGIPAGTYELRTDLLDMLGDTVEVLEAPPVTYAVNSGDTVQLRLGVTYPTLTISQVLAAPSGRRVFTQGIALNARDPFGDGVVHFQAGSTYLRTTDVERAPLGAGDSTKVLGSTATSLGRTVLTGVTPLVLIPSAVVPLPIELTTGSAADASSGVLDAALIQIRDANIQSVTDLGQGAYRIRANDGSGPVDIEIPGYLAHDGTDLVPGRTVTRATGLLRPASDGGDWRIHLRNSSDLFVSGS